MKIIYGDQGDFDWHNHRTKRLTASHAQEISANGAGLKTYITKMMAEYYMEEKPESYTNEYMQRGIELEAEALVLYEMATGFRYDKPVAFVVHDNLVGCSPDLFIPGECLAEIKCLKPELHFRSLTENFIESKYRHQMQMQMWICEMNWCDYISYHPDFGIKRQLHIIRVKKDEKAIDKIKIGIETGIKLIKEYEEKMS